MSRKINLVMTGDEHFDLFQQVLKGELERSGEQFVDKRQHTERQRRQVEKLVGLERRWRDKLFASRERPRIVYESLIRHVRETRGNLLSTRPYFRVRQADFTERVADALKTLDLEVLRTVDVNYPFIQFACRVLDLPERSPLRVLAGKVAQARNELALANLPLLVSQARKFKRSTGGRRLDFMDLVQTAVEGGMAAGDKFVLPYRPVFRSVLIGRAKGNLIEEYSATQVHYFPKEKRILYRVNKAVGRLGSTASPDQIARRVNEAARLPTDLTTPEEVVGLLGAQSPMSGDMRVRDDQDGGRPVKVIDTIEAPEETRPDVALVRAEEQVRFDRAISSLSLVQRKQLVLRGMLDLDRI